MSQIKARTVVLIECEGGSDKWFDGHRKDTRPIVEALLALDVYCEVVFYRDEWAATLADYITERASGYISRVNPGNIPGGEEKFFNFLRALSAGGLVGMSHPDVMINFGAKDALSKLAGSNLVPDDTYAYYDMPSLRENFPVSLSRGERVLKQNRGSTGSGIWRVRVEDGRTFEPGQPLPLDTQLKCTEAVDNHTEDFTLEGFLDFCEQYIGGTNGLVVDMKFLPRIKEGEIRVLLVGATPVFVVHKKPAEGADAFSATLFSGAKYTYDKPENWPILITHLLDSLPMIGEKLGGFTETPLLWTADFILDTDEAGNDMYMVGEFNCSCVGFTGHLDLGIQSMIAEEVVRRVCPATIPTPEVMDFAALPIVPAAVC
eukprot:TRINITY_DN3087_c6_g1_i1.p1 TRINITY_DN3087_c6_g1~~TRINITY_DN3087_c6_g1_i1.p1  ORF type:complete len:374 (+),score=97.81 TRINITY_DN3087_c6_g1_i1:77-1198(+)